MSRTVFEAYNSIKSELEKAGFEDFVFEAKQIIKHVTGFSNKEILNNYNEKLDEVAENTITVFLRQRLIHYPLQYILGSWEFYGLKFLMGPGVLVPRADSETVVDTALEFLKDKTNLCVLDLCAGSGCLGISVAKNKSDCAVTMLEKYEEAARYARKNCLINKAINTRVVIGDVLKGDGKDMLYDLIISNPPYLTKDEMNNLQQEVTYEPQTALDGGEDGLDFYRAIAENYKDALNSGGALMFEIGYKQAQAVKEIMTAAGYKNIEVKKDIENRDRVIFGTVN